jgi:glucose uptake protein
MILPGSYLFTLILSILSLFCLGSWANAYKLTSPRWRFELFAYDFAIGLVLAALILAFTFGTLGLDGFTVMDDLRLAGKRQDLFAFLAGCVFSLANISLLGAISLAGMTVAFPVCFGIALIMGAIVSYAGHPAGSLVLLTAGSAATFAAAVFAAAAWTRNVTIKAAAAREAAGVLAAQTPAAPAKTTSQSKSKKKPSKKKRAAGKALALAAFGGLVLGTSYPLMDMAKAGENGLGPYSLMLILAVGAAFSTFVCNLFFMNLPVQGNPVEFTEYFTGEARQHGLGILGGMVWCIGAAAGLVAARAEGAAAVGPALTYAIGQAPMILAALWGLMVWKDFGEAQGTVSLLLGAMFLLLVVGIGVLSVAPLYGAH